MKSDRIYKAYRADTIGRLITNLKRKGKKIVFTNGVFDILHYGHVNYLSRAREMGDVLIVGLNRDSSVRKFKPGERPIQHEMDRAKILAALRSVDYVVMFSEETPEKLIKAIKPDILAKGADYRLNQIVGADFVKSYGGQVRRIRITKGRSSSKIIKKLNL
jgi:rfaE bifunctional protein nucleotidyltransferase chain/domain